MEKQKKMKNENWKRTMKRKWKNKKWKTGNQKRKRKNEKREMKNKKQKTKNEKCKMKNKILNTWNEKWEREKMKNRKNCRFWIRASIPPKKISWPPTKYGHIWVNWTGPSAVVYHALQIFLPDFVKISFFLLSWILFCFDLFFCDF